MDLQKLRQICKIAIQFSGWFLNLYLEDCLLSCSEAMKHVECVQQLTNTLRFGNNKGRRNNTLRCRSSRQGDMEKTPNGPSALSMKSCVCPGYLKKHISAKAKGS